MPSLTDQIYAQAGNAMAGGQGVGIGQSNLAQNQSLEDLWSARSAGQTSGFLNQISQTAHSFLLKQPMLKQGSTFDDTSKKGLFDWLHEFLLDKTDSSAM